jgi:lipopolysaccharide transport system permease protein
MLMIVFTFAFHHVAKISSGGVPYPIFSYTALIPWTFFASSLAFSANSVIAAGGMITKVYFPRMLVAFSSTLSYLFDFALSFSILIAMMVYYGIYPNVAHVWLVVPLIVLALATAVGVGFWLAALNVRYRDVRFIVPFLINMWLFATPVVYPASSISGTARTIYSLNPMAGVVEGFRWALIDSGSLDVGSLLVSAAVALVVLVGGAYYFRRVERIFADVV